MHWSKQTFARNIAVWIAVMVPYTGGCAESGVPARPPTRDPAYAVGFYNGTGTNLTDVWARWQSHGIPWGASAGFLPPDPTGNAMGKVSEFQPDPIPDSVEVTWTTGNGAHHSRSVAVAAKVPDIEHFTGIIYLKYVSGDWKVIAISKAEGDRRADEGLPIVPPESPDHARPDLPTTRAGTAPAASPPIAATTRPVSDAARTLGHPASPAEKAAIIDALKYSRLASMRAELLPMGDYCESSDVPTQRLITAASHLSAAAHHLADAVGAKFGKQALGDLQLVLPDQATLLKESWPELKESGDPFPAELERAKVAVQGDRATVQMGSESIEVHKVEGRWKVQLPSLAKLAAAMGLGGDPQADPEHMARDSEWAAGIDERLATDVREGKFQSAAQVGEARAKRQQEVGELLNKNPDLYLQQQAPAGK